MKQPKHSSSPVAARVAVKPARGAVRPPPARPQAAPVTVTRGRLVRATAVELVAADLRARILSGELAPGAALRQVALAGELGVSRIPLREAIRLLSSEGLVDVQSHRGAYVSELSSAEVREFLDLRIQLEPWLLGLAVPHLQASHLERAEALVSQMDNAAADEWSRLNWQLHAVLYEPVDRPYAINIVRTLHEKCQRYLNRRTLSAATRLQARKEHMELIELCRRGDAHAASLAMARHVPDSTD
jgi:DNA-binding GntR family transcriptional regulator